MADVVVKIDVKSPESEAKLFEAVNIFAENKDSVSGDVLVCEDAPQIMIKTLHDGDFTKKAIIFQDRADAEAFMYFWRRHQMVA